MKNFPNFLGVKICFRGCENRAKFIVYAIGSIWADLEGFWILFQGCTGYMEGCTGYMGKVAQAIWRVAQAIWASCTGYMEVFLIIMLSQASWAGAEPELGNKVWMKNFPIFWGVNICFMGCHNFSKIGSFWAVLEGFCILSQNVAQAIWKRLHRL